VKKKKKSKLAGNPTRALSLRVGRFLLSPVSKQGDDGKCPFCRVCNELRVWQSQKLRGKFEMRMIRRADGFWEAMVTDRVGYVMTSTGWVRGRKQAERRLLAGLRKAVKAQSARVGNYRVALELLTAD